MSLTLLNHFVNTNIN